MNAQLIVQIADLKLLPPVILLFTFNLFVSNAHQAILTDSMDVLMSAQQAGTPMISLAGALNATVPATHAQEIDTIAMTVKLTVSLLTELQLVKKKLLSNQWQSSTQTGNQS